MITCIRARSEMVSVLGFYKSLIRRVSKKQIENRSKVAVHAGAQKSKTFPFHPEHPLLHSHLQRLNIKPLIVKVVGRGMPKDPGP